MEAEAVDLLVATMQHQDLMDLAAVLMQILAVGHLELVINLLADQELLLLRILVINQN